MIKGECNCGAVAFEAAAEPKDIFACHCSICRKASGASGIQVVLAYAETFRWLRGETKIAHWQKPDGDWHGWFCETCGSPLPGINDQERMFIPAGLITEGGENLKVTHRIWTGSKAPWDEILDDAKQHQEAFGS